MERAFTFWDLLEAHRRGAPERVALRDQGRDVTYGALTSEAEWIAARLHALGVRRGTRVAVHMAKSATEVAALFAVARIGAVFVPVNPGLAACQVAHILEDCDPGVVVADAPRARRLVESEGLSRTILQVDAPPGASGATDTPNGSGGILDGRCPVIDADLATLVYTSGSTGRPKGVMLTHANLVAAARSVAAYLDHRPDDRILNVLPLSFTYGLSQLVSTVLAGGMLVLQPVASPVDIRRTMVRESVTGVGLVPTLWTDLMTLFDEAPAALPCLRYATNAGGALGDDTLAAMTRHLHTTDIILMYGQTECIRATWLPPSRLRDKPGAIGIAVPNAEVFVVDPDRGLCPAGVPGELLQRGALVSKGYWNNPRLSAERIRPNPHLAALIGEEPVLHTGDLVRLDEDGVLWFVGRRDTLIKTSGYRISPTEIEEALMAGGRLEEAFVFGVPDPRLGQVIVAVVRPRPGLVLGDGDLRRACRGRLPGALTPARFHWHATAFPRTANGKIDGMTLKAAYGAGEDAIGKAVS